MGITPPSQEIKGSNLILTKGSLVSPLAMRTCQCDYHVEFVSLSFYVCMLVHRHMTAGGGTDGGAGGECGGCAGSHSDGEQVQVQYPLDT